MGFSIPLLLIGFGSFAHFLQFEVNGLSFPRVGLGIFKTYLGVGVFADLSAIANQKELFMSKVGAIWQLAKLKSCWLLSLDLLALAGWG